MCFLSPVLGRPLSLMVAAGALAVAGPAAGALGDVTIIGALSNFDVPNTTGQICDEFEIELHGPSSQHIYGFWRNYNYGLPVMAELPTGGGVLVNYRAPGRTTQPGVTEHFGIHMTNFGLINSRVFRWKRNGAVVAFGPGAPPVPIPTTTLVETPEGPEVVEAVENETPDQVIWVRRKTIVVPREVTLAELMPDDPLILATAAIDIELEMLEPGQTLHSTEVVRPEDSIQTQVIVVETHADVATFNSATGEWDHAPGVLVSRVMNATIIQARSCEGVPTITSQPVDASAPLDGDAVFIVAASGPAEGGHVGYQWRREGVVIENEDSPRLRIEPVTANDLGLYTCTVSNDCGSVETVPVRLSLLVGCSLADVTGVGGWPTLPDGLLTGDDFNAFISAFADSEMRADVTGIGGPPSPADGLLTGDDFVAFISAFAAGCP